MNCEVDKDTLSLSYLFSLFLRSQKHYFNYILRDYNISMSHIPILIKLEKYDYLYQKDISKTLAIDNGLLTRQLRKLEDEELIKRIEDNENRRQNKISLTEKGKEITKFIYQKGYEREISILENTDVSHDEIIEILLSILQNSKEYNLKHIKKGSK